MKNFLVETNFLIVIILKNLCGELMMFHCMVLGLFYALINITENMRKALDDRNIDCGVFVDLQKAFDTVDHQILLAKLNHYVIHGVSNDWFKSYLSNCNQYLSVIWSCCFKLWCPSRICSRTPSIFIVYKWP